MQRMKTLLGVTEPCHGEYECTTCNRFWQSCRAWKDFGQKCKSCAKLIQASKLEQLFPYCCTSCGCQWEDKMKECNKCLKCGSTAKMFMFAFDRRQFIEAKKLQSNDDEAQADDHKKELCERCQASPTKDCSKAKNAKEERNSVQNKVHQEKTSKSSQGTEIGQAKQPSHSPPGSSGDERKSSSEATVTKIYEPPNWTLPSSDEDSSSPDSQGKFSSEGSPGNPETSFDSGEFYKVDVDTGHTNNKKSSTKPAQDWNFQEVVPGEACNSCTLTTATCQVYQRKNSIHALPLGDTPLSPDDCMTSATPVRQDEEQNGGSTEYCNLM